jgi:ABC-2 type transport system permease protein
MQKRMQEIIITCLVILIILFIGFNSAVFFFRVDITENHIFTIDDVSKNLFKDIPEQVSITYYVSEKIKNLHPLPMQIEDMLNEYAAYSKGKINLTVKYPIEQKLEYEAKALKIYPKSIPVQEQGETRYIEVYMGIAIQYLDKYVVLPFVNQVETLEYELTSSIRRLVRNKEKTVGIILGRDDVSLEQYQELIQNFEPAFKVEQLARGEDIPSHISVLFVLGNTSLEDFDLFPIDQYIMRGGKALFAVEGVNINQQYMVGIKLEKSPLLEMLKKYGIEVKPELVVDNVPVPIQDRFGGIFFIRYPYWVVADAGFASKTNPITSHFGGAVFYWVSPLELALPAGVNGELILNSTNQSAVITDQFNIRPDQAAVQYEIAKKKSMQSYGLAAAVSGEIPSYFSDKEIPTRKGMERSWKTKDTKSKDTRLIIMGDADVGGTGPIDPTNLTANIALLANSADWLSNDDDLLKIKTRSNKSRQLYKIQDKEKRALVADTIKWGNTIIVPVIIILIGSGRYLSRKKKQKIYEVSIKEEKQ